MAKQYTCEMCEQSFMADRETRLVEKVQDHARAEHGTSLEAEQIRHDIEDT